MIFGGSLKPSVLSIFAMEDNKSLMANMLVTEWYDHEYSRRHASYKGNMHGFLEAVTPGLSGRKIPLNMFV